MVPPPAAEGRNSGEVVSDEEELRALLERSAAANSQALLEELAEAPDSVRAALERALAIANLGYDQNLSNLAP